MTYLHNRRAVLPCFSISRRSTCYLSMVVRGRLHGEARRQRERRHGKGDVMAGTLCEKPHPSPDPQPRSKTIHRRQREQSNTNKSPMTQTAQINAITVVVCAVFIPFSVVRKDEVLLSLNLFSLISRESFGDHWPSFVSSRALPRQE